MRIKESQSESNQKSQMETKIVNFLDIDTSKITFCKPIQYTNNMQTNTMELKLGYCMKEKHYL